MKGTSLVLGLLLVAAFAQQPVMATEGGFDLQLDPIEFEVLTTDVDTRSAKFQEYRDLGSGLRIPYLALTGESEDGERTLALWARNVGRDDARLTMRYGLAGKYSLLVDYNKIPHLFGNDGTFLWTATSTAVFEIPDPVQQQLEDAINVQYNTNPSGINYDFLNGLISPFLATASEIDLGLQRDRTRARFDLGKMGRLAWGFDFFHENRTGIRPYAGSFGFGNAPEIYEPIDYDTTDAEVSGEWNGDKGGVRFGYRHSLFENANSTLIWDNPFRITDSTDGSAYTYPGSRTNAAGSRGFADLAPENEANMVFVSGRADLGSEWWLNGSLSVNRMTQDDPLLPYTLNTSIDGIDHETGATFDATALGALPARNADAEVEVTTLTASAGRDFGEDWSLKFRYRYYDYDNKSPRIELPGYVRYHAVWEEVPRITVPYAYTRDRIGAELGWDATDRTKVTLSYDLETWDREYRETGKTEEDILKLTVDSKLSDQVNLHAGWERGDRTLDHYETEAQELSFLEPEGINNQPGLRKYLQAARTYDDYDLQLQWFASDTWYCTLGVSGREEDYDDSDFGLIADEILQYNGEINYSPGEGVNFYLFAHVADRESFQRARQSGATLSESPLDTWELTLDEQTTTFGLGLSGKNEGGWSYDAVANYSESDGGADFFTLPGGNPSSAEDFDNYEDIELLSFQLTIEYALRANVTFGLRYLYEDYTINSFNLQGLMPYLPSTFLLAANEGDYQANVVGLLLRFKL